MDLIKQIFPYKKGVRPFFNPFINMQMNGLGDYLGVNSCKRETPIIVSLTCEDENFDKLPITLYSILNQELKADRIILWIDEKIADLTSLPYEITQFVKNGLEIRFVRYLKKYTKTIYALKEFPTSIIVTADETIYYPSDWLKRLYLSYVSHPKDIHTHRVKKVDLETPYSEWDINPIEEFSGYENLANGLGGILYPPNCFSKEVLREDVYLKNAQDSDELWFWVMELVHNRKIRLVKNHIKTFASINYIKQIFSNDKVDYDAQLTNIMKFYGQNVLSKVDLKSKKY